MAAAERVLVAQVDDVELAELQLAHFGAVFLVALAIALEHGLVADRGLGRAKEGEGRGVQIALFQEGLEVAAVPGVFLNIEHLARIRRGASGKGQQQKAAGAETGQGGHSHRRGREYNPRFR